MLQGPSCRLTHCAGVISGEAPLLVVSRGGKGDIGELKKEGQARGSIVHREDHDSSLASASSQFFYPCTLLSLVSSSVHFLLFLNHLQFCDDHVSTAPVVFAGKPSMQGTS